MEPSQPETHEKYMLRALGLAKKSPPKPSNYRVGAVLVDAESNEIQATGYTLELPGNTHAEQCCFMKLAERYGVSEDNLKEVAPKNLLLYTTMEPCSKRLSGNVSCVERVLRLASSIKTVYVGVLEPKKFVTNTGIDTLRAAGIDIVHVQGLEQEILDVATAGHDKQAN
jgi:pyrimidine deaminase RibD-like protein